MFERQFFFPGVLGLVSNPFYFARKGLAKAMAQYSKSIRGRLLDVGCGRKPYEELFSVDEYIGLEYDSPENRSRAYAEYFYDGGRFPFEAEEYDAVISNQVLEHVFEPDVFVKEIHRVLKPDGLALITVPFVWDEHEQPIDYARYSSFGLRYLFEKNGFEVIAQDKTHTDLSVIFQLLNAYLYKTYMGKHRVLDIAIKLFMIFPVNLSGLLLSKIFPKNSDLYLDNVLLVRKAKHVK